MMESKDAMERVEVRFVGRVQGVGFRYSTVLIARQFPVVGYVRNEPDGSVRLVAEGRPSDLLAFLGAIEQSHLGRYIIERQIRHGPATGEFIDFDIRY